MWWPEVRFTPRSTWCDRTLKFRVRSRFWAAAQPIWAAAQLVTYGSADRAAPLGAADQALIAPGGGGEGGARLGRGWRRLVKRGSVEGGPEKVPPNLEAIEWMLIAPGGRGGGGARFGARLAQAGQPWECGWGAHLEATKWMLTAPLGRGGGGGRAGHPTTFLVQVGGRGIPLHSLPQVAVRMCVNSATEPMLMWGLQDARMR